MSTIGQQLIDRERQRQISVEGWSLSHDDQHGAAVLSAAAQCYLNADDEHSVRPKDWPWDGEWWKPKTKMKNLVRAGALFKAASEVSVRAGDQQESEVLLDKMKHCAAELSSMLSRMSD